MVAIPQPYRIRSTFDARSFTFITDSGVEFIRAYYLKCGNAFDIEYFLAMGKPRQGTTYKLATQSPRIRRHTQQEACVEVVLYFAHTLSREEFWAMTVELLTRSAKEAATYSVVCDNFLQNNQWERLFLAYACKFLPEKFPRGLQLYLEQEFTFTMEDGSIRNIPSLKPTDNRFCNSLAVKLANLVEMISEAEVRAARDLSKEDEEKLVDEAIHDDEVARDDEEKRRHTECHDILYSAANTSTDTDDSNNTDDSTDTDDPNNDRSVHRSSPAPSSR